MDDKDRERQLKKHFKANQKVEVSRFKDRSVTSTPRYGSAARLPRNFIDQPQEKSPMSTNVRNRRHFVAQAAAAASALAFPMVGGARLKPVKIGVLHPVTGALAFSGQQCREGALMAIDDINKAGGIKALGGAKIEPGAG